MMVAADPYFTRGGTIFRFMPIGGCAPYLGVAGTVCTESTTPIQAALNDVNINGLPTDNTVHVDPGLYNENITISTPNLILIGNTGDPTVAGADVNAPTLHGDGTGDGVTITADGVTLTGIHY